jgi:hypothetical protein
MAGGLVLGYRAPSLRKTNAIFGIYKGLTFTICAAVDDLKAALKGEANFQPRAHRRNRSVCQEGAEVIINAMESYREAAAIHAGKH